MQIFVENIEDDILFLTFYRFSWWMSIFNNCALLCRFDRIVRFCTRAPCQKACLPHWQGYMYIQGGISIVKVQLTKMIKKWLILINSSACGFHDLFSPVQKMAVHLYRYSSHDSCKLLCSTMQFNGVNKRVLAFP